MFPRAKGRREHRRSASTCLPTLKVPTLAFGATVAAFLLIPRRFFFFPTPNVMMIEPTIPSKVAGRAAIVSLAKDLGHGAVERKVEPLLTRLGNLFDSYQIVIVESNSSDDTRVQLESWQQRAPKTAPVHLILESGNHDMAHWRNLYLEQVRKQGDKSHFDYLVVVDADMHGIDIAGVLDSLTQHNEKDWAALVANGQRRVDRAYYDVLATRAEWNGNKFLFESPEGTIEMGATIRQFTVRIDSSSDQLIPVHSGFGGIGVYKTEYLKGCSYCRHNCNIDMGSAHCEHVAFHHCVSQKNNGRIYVNPKMVTTWHWDCADCCSDQQIPCERCTCAPPLDNFTWAGIMSQTT